ncbi:MAG: single-stranded-DNA-specific exonuclease RecJ [Ruminiclostridium sp.]|nr:single-stranded-DNA-specific exonuclease RecJ [Ruminiclostridium sp.]
MNKWKVNIPDRDILGRLIKETGLPEFICRILVSRGITSHAEAEVFFNGNEFSDPLAIKDMDKAVITITEAVENGTHITIYGDYDCDGVTSTYMLYSYLEALGGEVSWYIPTRDEGYGLNKPAIDLLKKQGTELLITVDNGISAVEEAAYIKELGMKLVVTDHHRPPEILPEAEAVVDPHRVDDFSEYKQLAGCGVVLKLIMAMEGDSDSVLTQYADIAAIGTVGDIVKLDGENRIIVREGLRLMENTENMGLNRLLAASGHEDGTEITSTFLQFSICPRINAAGRYESPRTAMELLLCGDMRSAAAKAEELSRLNNMRKDAETEIIRKAEETIRRDPDLLNRRLLIVSGDGWKHGIIGIASAKLLHKYGKPNIVMTREGDTARGSARSTDDLPLYDLLDSCSDLLVRFGGHTKAAGLTISSDMIEAFTQAAYRYCDERIKETAAELLEADMEIFPADMRVENIELIENLEPFGEGNPAPLFLLRECVVRSKKALKDGKYTSFAFVFGGVEARAVYFGASYEAFPFGEGDTVDILANLAVNEYNDRRSISVIVKDVRYSDFRQERYFAAKTAYEDMRCGTVDGKLLCRMAPDSLDMRRVYDILRQTGICSKAEILADRAGINCCKFRVILDVFAEFGLAETDITADTVKLIPTSTKADLSKSKVLARMRELAANS